MCVYVKIAVFLSTSPIAPRRNAFGTRLESAPLGPDR